MRWLLAAMLICACDGSGDDPDLAACFVECTDLEYERAAFCGWDASAQPPRRICECWTGERATEPCLRFPSE
jgi:hypothetical protein